MERKRKERKIGNRRIGKRNGDGRGGQEGQWRGREEKVEKSKERKGK